MTQFSRPDAVSSIRVVPQLPITRVHSERLTLARVVATPAAQHSRSLPRMRYVVVRSAGAALPDVARRVRLNVASTPTSVRALAANLGPYARSPPHRRWYAPATLHGAIVRDRLGVSDPLKHSRRGLTRHAPRREGPMPNGEGGRLQGNGMIRDEPGDRLAYEVQGVDAGKKIQFGLKAADNITWWKSLDLYVLVNGGWIHSKRAETKDDNRYAQVDFFENEQTDQFKLEFWKGGVIGFGAKSAELVLDGTANEGSKIIFTWVEDKQPGK
jgi:hypothetical protein